MKHRKLTTGVGLAGLLLSSAFLAQVAQADEDANSSQPKETVDTSNQSQPTTDSSAPAPVVPSATTPATEQPATEQPATSTPESAEVAKLKADVADLDKQVSDTETAQKTATTETETAKKELDDQKASNDQAQAEIDKLNQQVADLQKKDQEASTPSYKDYLEYLDKNTNDKILKEDIAKALKVYKEAEETDGLVVNNQEGNPGNINEAIEAIQIVKDINAYRKAAGIGPMYVDPIMTAGSQIHHTYRGGGHFPHLKYVSELMIAGMPSENMSSNAYVTDVAARWHEEKKKYDDLAPQYNLPTDESNITTDDFFDDYGNAVVDPSVYYSAGHYLNMLFKDQNLVSVSRSFEPGNTASEGESLANFGNTKHADRYLASGRIMTVDDYEKSLKDFAAQFQAEQPNQEKIAALQAQIKDFQNRIKDLADLTKKLNDAQTKENELAGQLQELRQKREQAQAALTKAEADANAAKPAEPAKPSTGETDKPAEPTKPDTGTADKPAEPSKPDAGTTDKPVEPSKPDTGTTDQPVEPSKPDTGTTDKPDPKKDFSYWTGIPYTSKEIDDIMKRIEEYSNKLLETASDSEKEVAKTLIESGKKQFKEELEKATGKPLTPLTYEERFDERYLHVDNEETEAARKSIKFDTLRDEVQHDKFLTPGNKIVVIGRLVDYFSQNKVDADFNINNRWGKNYTWEVPSKAKEWRIKLDSIVDVVKDAQREGKTLTYTKSTNNQQVTLRFVTPEMTDEKDENGFSKFKETSIAPDQSVTLDIENVTDILNHAKLIDNYRLGNMYKGQYSVKNNVITYFYTPFKNDQIDGTSIIPPKINIKVRAVDEENNEIISKEVPFQLTYNNIARHPVKGPADLWEIRNVSEYHKYYDEQAHKERWGYDNSMLYYRVSPDSFDMPFQLVHGGRVYYRVGSKINRTIDGTYGEENYKDTLDNITYNYILAGNESDLPKSDTSTTDKPVEPTKPDTGTTDKPSEPAKPDAGNTDKPSEPTNPSTGTTDKPSEPTKPDTGTTDKPVEPTKPSTGDTNNPAEPAKPNTGTTDKPVEPTKPDTSTTDKPSEPTKPDTGTTDKPSEPAKPDTGTTDKPAEPAKPDTGTADKPVEPTKPDTGTTDKPVEPTKPDAGTTDKPVEPAKPNTGTTDKPAEPAKPDTSTTDKPAEPVKPDTGTTNKPTEPTKPDTGTTDKPAEPAKPDAGTTDKPVEPTTPTDNGNTTAPVTPTRPTATNGSGNSTPTPTVPVDATRSLKDPVTGVAISGKGDSLAGVVRANILVTATNVFGGQAYNAYEITLLNEQMQAVQPKGYVTVTLPTNGLTVDQVYYITKNNRLEALPFTLTNGGVAFDTNHFSTYAVTYQAGQRITSTETVRSQADFTTQTAPTVVEESTVQELATTASAENQASLSRVARNSQQLPNTGDKANRGGFLAGILLFLSSIFFIGKRRRED